MNKQYRLAFICASLLLVPFAQAQSSGFYVGIEAGQSQTQLDLGIAPFSHLLNPPVSGAASDRSDTAFGMSVGYEFADRFAVELSYTDLGEASYTTVRNYPPLPSLPPSSDIPPFIDFRPIEDINDLRDLLNPVAGVTTDVIILPYGTERRELTFDAKSLSLTVTGRYALPANLSLLGRAGLAAHRYETHMRIWLNDQRVLVIGADQDDSAAMAILGAGVQWDFHPRWNARVQYQRQFDLGDESIDYVARGDVTLITGGIMYRF